MRILAFSINPLFPDQVTGGASRHLERLASHLVTNGHDVKVLCASPKDGPQVFKASGGYQVKATLPFHQPFPQPYAVAPYELSEIFRLVSEELQGAERFYIHDGELLLLRGFVDVPTICSFRDNYYPESILGSFLTQADEIIAVSPYSAQVLLASAGALLEGFPERLHQINNGLDAGFYYPQKNPKFRARLLGEPEGQGPILIHPHRIEAGKGFETTFELVRRLVQEPDFRDLRVLVPCGLPAMQGEAENAFMQVSHESIEALGLGKHFIFHPWLAVEDMPAYYSLADLTIALGTAPEAFGNVAYESLLCGTPSLVYKIGTHRSQLPDGYLLKASPQDFDEAVDLARAALRNKRRISAEERREIASFFPAQEQLEAYTRVITQATKRVPMAAKPLSVLRQQTWGLAPWCYLVKNQIYHDYKQSWYLPSNLPELAGALAEIAAEGKVRSIRDYPSLRQLGILAPLTE